MKWHQALAGSLGYELIRKRKLAHLVPGSHLARLLASLEIDHVIDVGANLGQYGEELRYRGYEGYIWSFEPVSANYNVLAEKARHDPKWRVFQMALGASNGEMPINVTRGSTFTSFRKPNEYSHVRWQKGDTDVVAVENVPLRRLDNLFSEIFAGFDNPRIFLKMDTQGYDLEVFAGAEGMLNRVFGLQSEVSVLPIYEGMPDYIQSLTTYRAKGFEVTGLYPVSRDDQGMVVIEFDCFMRRVKA